MHFSDFTPSSAPARWVRLAACTLLPAFIQDAAAGGAPRHAPGRPGAAHFPPSAPPASAPSSPPYLLVSLPPPLRFAEPVEPAGPLSSQAVALGPPHPGGLLEEIAALNHQAAMTTLPPESAPVEPAADSPETAPAGAPASSPASAPTGSAPVAAPRVGLAILPDDTPRAIRAEDVLVYFQFPAASPANDAPPRSSATYRQQ